MATATAFTCGALATPAVAVAVTTASLRGQTARPAFVNSQLGGDKLRIRIRAVKTVSSGRVPALTVCKISKGDIVPPVGLKDQDGKLVNLDKFRGKPLVLYFYPADETPGCTKQACAFRDSYEKFRKAGAEVVGVSGDPPASHKAFKAKYKLPFTLLSDENNKLRTDWGVPSDFFGALAGRQTYVIDKDGRVQLIFNNQFEPEKHISETLSVLQG